MNDLTQPSDSEARYADEGGSHIAAVRNRPERRSIPENSRNESKEIYQFPEWFSELQFLLATTINWSQVEEDAQEHLHAYASWVVEQQQDFEAPPSLEVFFRYIGRSEDNQASAASGGFRNSGELGGRAGAADWCQHSSTLSVEKALGETYGLRFKRGPHDTTGSASAQAWVNRRGSMENGGLYGRDAYDAPLYAGDWVSYFYRGSQAGGHLVTVTMDYGNSFVHVSGNTCGGQVRLAEALRMTHPPASFDCARAETDNSYAGGYPYDGQVIVWRVSRVSTVWEELKQIEGLRTEGDQAAIDSLLDRLDLEPA